MLSPNRIVIDTSAFCALILSKHINHSQAKLAYEHLLDWEWELWTTSYILLETSTVANLEHEPLKVFTDAVLSNIFNVAWVDKVVHEAAFKRMIRAENQMNLVNWTTIVIAESLNARIFTFNQNFRQEGILIFPHSKA